MIELKWQRVISFSIYLSRHHTQRPMAWRLSMLHYSNWPMSHLHEGPHWFLFTHALWKYTESWGVKYWYIKSKFAGQRQNQPVGTSECRKPPFIMCLYFFIQDLIGRALRSGVKLQHLAEGHFSRTDACQLKGLSPDHPAKGHSLLSLSHPAAVFTIHSIQRIHHKFFMSMSKYCSEKTLLYFIPCIYLKKLSTSISIMY